MRSAAAQRADDAERKVEATWDPTDPVFTPRERAALEMASIFTEDYKAFTDQQLERWREHFTGEELVELATFMALADGFGKVVEMLGLGDADQTCQFEV